MDNILNLKSHIKIYVDAEGEMPKSRFVSSDLKIYSFNLVFIFSFTQYYTFNNAQHPHMYSASPKSNANHESSPE